MKAPTLLKQKNMLRVLYALIPVFLGAVYCFGWRVAGLCITCAAVCFVTEWVMADARGGKVSYACFVTALLLALSLPPSLPYWMAGVGSIVAILIAKEAFGGFGKNVFNPAIVGRAFIYVCFPVDMTARFVPSFNGFPGGLAQWSYLSQKDVPADIAAAGMALSDAVSTATPMLARRDYGFVTDILHLVLGDISGVFQFKTQALALSAGSAGEVSAVAILIGAVVLLATKTAQWRLMLSTVLGAAALNIFLRNALGISDVPPLVFSLTSGALLYCAVFMVTDPVSAPKKPLSQWLYGGIIGALIILIRYKAVFIGGAGFAILFGNMLAPSFDLWLGRLTAAKAPVKAAV